MISLCPGQTNAKALKVVKHKSDWKVYRSGIEIPKSHFFRIINDEYNRDQSIMYEREFMTKRFKLSCFKCGNSSLGLLSLASVFESNFCLQTASFIMILDFFLRSQKP